MWVVIQSELYSNIQQFLNGPCLTHKVEHNWTSAGVKTSFAYDLLLDVFEDSIIHPKSSFSFGCDYRVPMMHGLLDKTYINKLRSSPSYNEESFAREYMSIWSGSSDESWFNFDKLQKYRKIKNPEMHAKFRETDRCFYLISVDRKKCPLTRRLVIKNFL